MRSQSASSTEAPRAYASDGAAVEVESDSEDEGEDDDDEDEEEADSDAEADATIPIAVTLPAASTSCVYRRATANTGNRVERETKQKSRHELHQTNIFSLPIACAFRLG